MTKLRVVSQPSSAVGSDEASSELTGYSPSTGSLPPELVTGHKQVDIEHAFLISSIDDLRKICKRRDCVKDCGDCGLDQQKHCEAQLVNMLGDVFAFILDHFKTEEAVMRDSLLLMVDRDVCEAHMEDHAAISSKVLEIVSSLDALHVVSRIREMDDLLCRWMTNHITLHDSILTRWVTRDDSVLKLL
jgi:hemerythrin-like metal-binding protein